MKPNILYIGLNQSWFLDLQYLLKQETDLISFNYSSALRINSIQELDSYLSNIIIIDYSYGNVSNGFLYNNYKSLFPFGDKILIGIVSEVNHKEINELKKDGVSFIFKKTIEKEEIKFTAKTIISILDDRKLKKGEFAVAKTEYNTNLTLNSMITEFSFKRFTVESNIKFNKESIYSFNSPLFTKINFINNNNKSLLNKEAQYDKNKNHMSFFDNNILTAEEINSSKQIAELEGKDSNDFTKKKLIQKKIIDKVDEKKHKYLQWKKSYQNYYKHEIKDEIFILGQSNQWTSLKNNALNNKYNVFNKKRISRSDQSFLEKIIPKYVFIEMENSSHLKDFEGNIKFNDFKFKQNSIKTILYLAEIFQNKIKQPTFIIFNKTETPTSYIKQALKGLFCELYIYDIRLNSSTIEEVILELEQIESKQIDKKNKLKSSHRFLNKKDVLEKKLEEVPLFFNKEEEINSLEINIPVVLELFSEFQLVISSETELPKLVPIKMNYPFSFYVTLIDHQEYDNKNKYSSKKLYKGIIHGIEMKTRDQIRGFSINHKKQYKVFV